MIMGRIHILGSIGLLLALCALLGGCYLSRQVPTVAVSRQGTDSVQVKEESIPLSGLRVLLVNREDTVNGKDSLIEEFAGWWWEDTQYYEIPKQSTWQSVQTLYYDWLVTEKASNMLKVHTDALVVDMVTVYDEEQFGESCKESNYDLLIVNEQVSFLTTLEMAPFGGFTSPSIAPHAIYSGRTAYSYTVYYASRWRLLWRDASQPSGFREQPIVQRGGYWEQKSERSAGGVLACALKAGEDFARLFR